MTIHIKAFGVSKDILGASSLDLDIPQNTNVNTLLNLLKTKYPKFSELQSLHIAVNEDYAESDIILKSNDEIALIPPVSGG